MKNSMGEIIHIGISELNKCIQLDLNAFGGFWSESQWKEELVASRRLRLGLFTKSNLTALAIALKVLDEIQIIYLAVDPKYQNIGLGKTIISNLLDIAKEKGVKSAYLEVDKNNLIALNFYKKLKFIKIGERKNYYSNQNSAFVLQKNTN